MTRGAKGALLVCTEDIIDQPGISTTIVDTVGAGDSFTASLTTGLLGGLSHSQILREACEAASAVCAQRGGIPDCSHPRTQGLLAN
jgi:fructokinase